jgi:hypothetical protein
MDLRKRVKRQDPPGHKRRKAGSPLDAIEAGTPGDVKVSVDAMVALQHLYHTSPSIQAARQILMGQLLSSGVVVRRDGNDVKLKPVFSRHLEDQWIPFARTVIDHFLMFGFVVVSIEPEGPPAFANLLGRGKEVAALSNTRSAAAPNRTPGGPAGRRDHTVDNDAAAARARKKPIVSDEEAAKRAAETFDPSLNLVPFVPVCTVGAQSHDADSPTVSAQDLGQYDVSFHHVGAYGYRRQYRVFATTDQAAYRQDYNAEIFFKSEPDAGGNIVSPIATVFQSASFVSALEELALQAEVVRARQMLVTQPMVRQAQNQNLDPANLFFDSESRAIQSSSTADDDAQQAQGLAMAAKLMNLVNRMQTTAQDARPTAASSAAHVPPPLPPTLFAAPEKHQVVPGVRPPEARSDLVDIIRVVNDHGMHHTHAQAPHSYSNNHPCSRRQSQLQWECQLRLSSKVRSLTSSHRRRRSDGRRRRRSGRCCCGRRRLGFPSSTASLQRSPVPTDPLRLASLGAQASSRPTR